MIRKLKTTDIAQILKMDDPIDKIFPCEKGEWIQWLNQNVDHPELYIIGKAINGSLKSYAVAVNTVGPPLSDAVSIIFMSESDKRFIKRIKSWARKKQAKKVVIQSTDKDVIDAMGIDELRYIGIWNI
ncbi:hypothetical protein KA005_18960 [bacterium]|nr:hypothetical protein [bacterium]